MELFQADCNCSGGKYPRNYFDRKEGGKSPFFPGNFFT